MNELPPAGATGAYALVFELETPLEAQVGRLGPILLPAGYAVYVGSALGPGGLRARIERHFRSEKRMHWHIDAITTLIRPRAWYCDASGRHLECQWAQALAGLPGASIPLPGFGSSDCRSGCPAHFIHFPPSAPPDLTKALARPGNRLIYWESEVLSP